jgi:antitoxin Phd
MKPEKVVPKNRRTGSRRANTAVSWQLQTAKARFSEVFRRARAEGPQRVTRQGKEEVVVVAGEEFDRLAVCAAQPKSLVEFFRESPLAKVKLDLTRVPDYGREIEL